MIKISKDIKNIKIGNKQVLKVYKSDRVVWQKQEDDKLIMRETNRFSYDIEISNSSPLKPNQTYKFVSNRKNDDYVLTVDNKTKYKLKSNDVFSVDRRCWIAIEHASFELFDIFIYKTTAKPNLKINV